MKKAVLFLFFCFSISYSQSLPSLETCSNDLNVPTPFDLSLKYAEILGSNNPADYQITFHYSEFDAVNGYGAIQNPTSYFITSPSELIFARSLNTVDSTFYIESFSLIVNQNPVANPVILFFCDMNELAIYNLNESIPIIIGNSTEPVIVSFFVTEFDALANTNPIPNGTFIPTVLPTQILFARVTNEETDCFSITNVTLNTHNCPQNCPTPNQLTLSNITNTSAILNWSSQLGTTTSYWQISIVPTGELPDQNSTITAQTAPFTVTGLTQNTCYSFYVRAVCFEIPISQFGEWSAPLNACLMDCTNNGQCPEQLELISFLDQNNNGTKEAGEPLLNNGSFAYQINNSSETNYVNTNSGIFNLFVSNPMDSYDISFEVNEAYSTYFSSTTTYNDITAPAGSGSTSYYFPIQIIQEFNDIGVSIFANSPPRPGFTYTNTIVLKNNGYTNIASGILHFTKDAAVSIVSVSQAGTIATPSGFDYVFTDLGPFETRDITVTMEVPTIPTVNLGAILTNVASIEPLDNEENLENNTASLSQVVIGSYDPNDKNESHGGKIEFENFTADDYLYYTIRFENTGTAAAEFIRIEDVLEPSLDETTFEMLNASHSFTVRRTGNQLVWHFLDINLPPSVENTEIGKGFVHFKIKPKAGFALGDIISNTAEIYFDYNPAIITNTMETQFVENLSVADFSSSSVVLYPNPTKEAFQIQLNGSDVIKTIAVYDVVGKRILQKENVNLNSTSVAVSGFNQGIYFVEITTSANAKAIKKLIVQ